MLAHQVMHEHVCRAGDFGPAKVPIERSTREAFDRVVLEPGRQIVVRTLSQQVDHPIRTIANRAMTPEQGGTLLKPLQLRRTGSTGVFGRQLPHDAATLEITRELG